MLARPRALRPSRKTSGCATLFHALTSGNQKYLKRFAHLFKRSTAMSTALVDDIKEIKESNPFESMMSRFDRAAQLLNLDPDLYAVLRVPNRELKVYIPTRMDSGRIQVFEGFRVQHNFARGPAKGG